MQYLPVVQFMRLAATCAAVLADCSDDSDFDCAAALGQVAHFYYTEPLGDKDASTVMQALGVSRGALHTAWGSRRHTLHQELGREPIWQKVGVWDALLSQQVAVALLQERHGQVGGSAGPAPLAAGSAFALLQVMILPMVTLEIPLSDLRSFLSRACATYDLSEGDERALLGVLSALSSAGSSPAPTLTTYEAFAAGQASAMSAPAASKDSTPLGMIGAAARAVLAPPAPGSVAAARAPAVSVSSASAAASDASKSPARPRPANPALNSIAPVSTDEALPIPAPATVTRSSPTSSGMPLVSAPLTTTSESLPVVDDAAVSLEGKEPLPPPVAVPVPGSSPAGVALTSSSLSTAAESVSDSAHGSAPFPAPAPPPVLPGEPSADPASVAEVLPPPPASVVAVPHPWQTLSRKDADALAQELLCTRMYAPPPGGAILALLEVRRVIVC